MIGTACGLGVEGSGWVAAPGLVVTNAHVVAGEDDTTVTTRSGASLDATPVYYDPENDLALLRIDAPLPALPTRSRHASEASRGLSSATPRTAPTTPRPPASGKPVTWSARTPTATARSAVRSASLRGSVRSGNSGGPLVDRRGRVLGTVFATTTYGSPGGFAIPDEVVETALSAAQDEVDTGPCTA